eukprot:Sdes_comp16220_c0_seq1m5499
MPHALETSTNDCAPLEAEYLDILQLLIFVDDSVEVWFHDGIRLMLSPNASLFAVKELAGTHHPANESGVAFERGQDGWNLHKTRFVVSKHKQHVCSAIRYRNMFCERPYICPQISTLEDFPADLKWQHEEGALESCSWPNPFKMQEKSLKYFQQIPLTGDFLLKSVEGRAEIAVTNHHQTIRVRYIVDVNRHLSAHDDSSQEPYFWQEQWFSMHEFPSVWAIPVLIALFLGHSMEDFEGPSGCDLQGLLNQMRNEFEIYGDFIVTSLPHPLSMDDLKDHSRFSSIGLASASKKPLPFPRIMIRDSIGYRLLWNSAEVEIFTLSGNAFFRSHHNFKWIRAWVLNRQTSKPNESTVNQFSTRFQRLQKSFLIVLIRNILKSKISFQPV